MSIEIYIKVLYKLGFTELAKSDANQDDKIRYTFNKVGEARCNYSMSNPKAIMVVIFAKDDEIVGITLTPSKYLYAPSLSFHDFFGIVKSYSLEEFGNTFIDLIREAKIDLYTS